ncbi:hypothetical protein BDV32DRAFT_123932 [Aspergillus pseudonomiae]|nr:hypothetical protein BDV32DRAFT_123932 [Aspergillus pseudonomiae]
MEGKSVRSISLLRTKNIITGSRQTTEQIVSSTVKSWSLHSNELFNSIMQVNTVVPLLLISIVGLAVAVPVKVTRDADATFPVQSADDVDIKKIGDTY